MYLGRFRVCKRRLQAPSSAADLVAWSEGGATAGTAPAPSAIALTQLPLAISGDPSAAFTLWHVTPRLCNGLVLLGETSKFIVVSPQRIAAVELDCGTTTGGMVLALVGAPRERVEIAWARHTAVKTAVCVLGAAGKASLAISVDANVDPVCAY